jgi:membrane fusion protein, multidrug efflux system
MGIRQIDPGNLAHAPDAQPIAVLMRISPSAAFFTLPSRILDDARSALAPGPVEVTAFDQDGRRALSTGPIVVDATECTSLVAAWAASVEFFSMG